jgi:hypothetical protein
MGDRCGKRCQFLGRRYEAFVFLVLPGGRDLGHDLYL